MENEAFDKLDGAILRMLQLNGQIGFVWLENETQGLFQDNSKKLEVRTLQKQCTVHDLEM